MQREQHVEGHRVTIFPMRKLVVLFADVVLPSNNEQTSDLEIV